MSFSEQYSNVNLFFNKNKKQCFKLLQNPLLSEAKLIDFAKSLGFSVSGVIKGDPSDYMNLGWLNYDDLNTVSKEMFHPFRFYPLHVGGELCKLKISPTSSLKRDSFSDFLIKASEFLQPLDFIKKAFETANEVSTLAILLEPIYWSKIIKTEPFSTFSCEEYKDKLSNYEKKIKYLVKNLDPSEWHQHHINLIEQADKMDKNKELYMLLRLSSWKKTKKITGQIGGSLWIRLIAEVLRRAFRDVHDVKWLEEDLNNDQRVSWIRKEMFGTEFPTDNTLMAKQHLLFEFGLHTQSILRWYLEGTTEYYAALYGLQSKNLTYSGIELINLNGAIAENKSNSPFRLANHLTQDKIHRRFSVISFDGDVPANVKFLREKIEAGNIIGYINLNTPDFEFANFTLNELIEVAANLDDEKGGDGQAIRNGSWDNVKTGKEFEDRYKTLTTIRTHPKGEPPSLKGEPWGQALAQYALDNIPTHDSKKTRPFFETLFHVLRASKVKYEFQRDNFRINPETFQNEKIEQKLIVPE